MSTTPDRCPSTPVVAARPIAAPPATSRRTTLRDVDRAWPPGTAGSHDAADVIAGWSRGLRRTLDLAFGDLITAHDPAATPARRRLAHPVCSTAIAFAAARHELRFLPTYTLQRVEESQPFCCSSGPAMDPLRWLLDLDSSHAARQVVAACDEPRWPRRPAHGAAQPLPQGWVRGDVVTRTDVLDRLAATSHVVRALVVQMAHDTGLAATPGGAAPARGGRPRPPGRRAPQHPPRDPAQRR